jgi:hypothetical protein
LKIGNILFRKISETVALSLFKLGGIQVIEEGDIIYRENQINKKLFIILWGEVILKKQKDKNKLYCFAGDSLG